MNTAALSAYFAAHKVAILGGGAAAVAALGFYQHKKASSSTATTTSGATVPGTIPAAAVVSSGAGSATYDSTAFDIYDSLQQQISDVASQQQTGTTSGTSSATPVPIASTLFAPSYNGQYVRFADGQVDEVQSDGSLLWLDGTQSQQAFASKGGSWVGNVDQLTYNHPTTGVYNTGQNLKNKATTTAPANPATP